MVRARNFRPDTGSLFGEFVSRRDYHTVDDDAKMFFALTNAIFDGRYCRMDAKRRAFDSVRPIQAIPYLFQVNRITAWRPFHGAQTFDGALWIPYQTSTFPTPPFPEYISGHSSSARLVPRFLGSSRTATNSEILLRFAVGSSNTEPGLTPKPTSHTFLGHFHRCGKPGWNIPSVWWNPFRACRFS